MQFLQPKGWTAPKGYSNGVSAKGKIVCVAGQIGWNAEKVFETGCLVGQAEQALRNIVAILAEAGAGPEHVVRLTWYLTDRTEYLARQKELGAVYRTVFGRHFPAMSAVQVNALMEDDAKVEIEATAVL